MRGADVLIAALEAAQVKTIFALSGNQIMPVFDAVFDSDIRLIHTRHEATTVYMAEAFAQISGGIGVALVTAGAGLGNAVGALIAAQASDTPLLLLSGDSPVAADGRGAFQEMNQIAMTRDVTKGSRRVMHADDMAQAVAWAIERATTGRAGPVHLALPADVLTDQTEVTTAVAGMEEVAEQTFLDLEAFQKAKRPLVILGPQLTETRASGLSAALEASLNAPVIVMESPRGLGDPAQGRLRQIAQSVDSVLCLGKPVDFTLGFGDEAHWPAVQSWHVVLGDTAQLDAAHSNLGARLASFAIDDPHAMAQRLAAAGYGGLDRRGWIARVGDLRVQRIAGPEQTEISPHDICRAVQTHIDQLGDAILICDGGEFGQWAQAGVQASRRIINGVSGVIGGGIGYAIGAKASDPALPVFALMGDGTVGFHLSEFETAVRADLPFIVVIGNDRCWNAEHLIQARSFGASRQFGCELSTARYDLAVAALGGFGAYVTSPEQLGPALEAATKSGLPACINVAMAGWPAPSF